MKKSKANKQTFIDLKSTQARYNATTKFKNKINEHTQKAINFIGYCIIIFTITLFFFKSN